MLEKPAGADRHQLHGELIIRQSAGPLTFRTKKVPATTSDLASCIPFLGLQTQVRLVHSLRGIGF
jgi:hypothetical protein